MAVAVLLQSLIIMIPSHSSATLWPGHLTMCIVADDMVHERADAVWFNEKT
jgi:hypothetical protein